jgi:chromate reductase
MTPQHPLDLVGISGSLRHASYNTALLRASADLLPLHTTLEIIPIDGLPLFNEDSEKPFPAAVEALRERIARADGLLIATPEYNASVSGVLKNAIDWVSRPPAQPFSGKPVGIMGASPGLFGSVRSQLHLRQILTHVGALILPKPDILVGTAHQRFDSDGRLTDETTRRFLGQMLEAFAHWVRRLA